MSVLVDSRRPFTLTVVVLAILCTLMLVLYPTAHAEAPPLTDKRPASMLKPTRPPFDLEGDSWQGGEVCVADMDKESFTCYTDPAAYRAARTPYESASESCTGNGRHGVVLYDIFNALYEFNYINTPGTYDLGAYRNRLSSLSNFTYCRVVIWDANPQRAFEFPARSAINVTDWLVWWDNSADVITVMP